MRAATPWALVKVLSNRHQRQRESRNLETHVCITPAACGAVMPARMVQARVSFSPGVHHRQCGLVVMACSGPPLIKWCNCYSGNKAFDSVLEYAINSGQKMLQFGGACITMLLPS